MTSASAVSAALRRAGLNPLGSGAPRTREGVRVSSSHERVLVNVDVDSQHAARELAANATSALESAGFLVEPASWSPTALYVKR